MTVREFRAIWPQVLVKRLAELDPESDVQYLEFGVVSAEGEVTPIRLFVDESRKH